MFRFSIRDLLWLTVIVAMGTGWYISRRASQLGLLAWQQRAEALERIVIDRGYEVEVKYGGGEITITDGDYTVVYPIVQDQDGR